MKLSKIIISNYRCYGKKPTTVEVDNLIGFIGHNSSGKTAILSALIKLFGEKASDRIVERTDFHIPVSVDPEDISENAFFIETQFIFPELDGNEENTAIPIFFKNMVVNESGGKPYLRIRLEATWEKSSNPEGSIDINTYYITTPSEEVNQSDKRYVKRNDLDQIKVIYVPAIRKPDEQLKNVSGTIISRLLNGIKWLEETKREIKVKASEIEAVFYKEEGVKILKESLENQWRSYHKDLRYSNPKINFSSTDLETILKKVDVTFSPTEITRSYKIEELGDGLRSLFYFSLVNTLLEIEDKILLSMSEDEDKAVFNILPPILTIVAVEEPENHISPHLLGRVIEKLKLISNKNNSQTILTSHTPAIVKRIDPSNIRYFKTCNVDECSKVKSLTLPDKEKDEKLFKFIKEAVTAYPELYFAKTIVLGEGNSEEIIIKRMLELKNEEIDSSEISIVPLGGKHINHFWRLLYDLEIPFITLLDLDRERNGGGWGRIKYAIKELIRNGEDKNKLLETANGILSDKEFDRMHEWDVSKIELMSDWIERLKEYDVFFSLPLDIDYAMLTEFKDRYIKTLLGNEGPKLEKYGKLSGLVINDENQGAYESRIENDIRMTLKQEGGDGSTYSKDEKELMIWYTYFFLGRGKPTTHLVLFADNNDLSFDNFPECLRVFIDRVIEKNNNIIEDDSDNELD